MTAAKADKMFLVGRRRTETTGTYPDVGQAYARFAVHGGTFARTGVLHVSQNGGDAELSVDGGACMVAGTIQVAANSSEVLTKTKIVLSGGSLSASNIVINSSYKGTASFKWDGGVFCPMVDEETGTAEFSGGWAENGVYENGALFDLSRVNGTSEYRMAIPLQRGASLVGENMTDGGVHLVSGSGTLVLAVANTFIGPVRIDSGTLRADVPGAIPSGSTLIVNDSGIFNGNGLVHTVSKVGGYGGKCINGTVRVTGELSPTTVEFDRLVLADGAVLSLPLSLADGTYSSGFFSVKHGISAEGTLSLVFAGSGIDALPKDFAVKIATLDAGTGVFPTVVFDGGLELPRNCSLGLVTRTSMDGAVEVWAVVRPKGTVVVLR